MNPILRTFTVLAATAGSVLLAASCGGGEDDPASGQAPSQQSGSDAGAGTEPPPEEETTEVSQAAMTEARQYFQNTCTPCHGADGSGDGAAAAALDPKPRDLTDSEFQESITDEHIRKIILNGGAAVGKSPMMPPNPQLKSKPEVVDGLVRVVRELDD